MIKMICAKKALTRLSPLCLIASTLFLVSPLHAAEVLLTDEGREVQINDDGSWYYLSQDRYTTNKNGERIRLKSDGSWEVVIDDDQAQFTPSNTTLNKNSQTLSASQNINFRLSHVEIQKYKKKVSQTQKSANTETRMLFTLELINRGDKALDLKPLLARDPETAFTVKDSKNRTYRVLKVIENEVTNSKQNPQLTIIADGSPRWWGVKYMSLKIEANILNENAGSILSRNMGDIPTVNVEGF